MIGERISDTIPARAGRGGLAQLDGLEEGRREAERPPRGDMGFERRSKPAGLRPFVGLS